MKHLLYNHIRQSTLLLLMFCIISTTVTQAHAAENGISKKGPRKRLAVLAFTANNTSAGMARIARNAVEMALFKTGLYDILEKEHINLIMDERKRQIDECRDSSFAAAIGELLSAEYIVIGSVDRGAFYVIQVKVVDVKKKRIVIVETSRTSDSKKIRRTAERISRTISRRMERLGKKGKPLVVSAAFNVLTPLGYLAEKVDIGFGFTLNFLAEDIFFKGFQAGVSARFIHYTGKSHEAHHAMMVPINLVLGYRFTIEDFSINPGLGMGGSYSIVYYYRDRTGSDYSGNAAFQPVLLFSLDLTYSFTPILQLQLRPEYAMIFEKDGIIQFLSAGIGLALLF